MELTDHDRYILAAALQLVVIYKKDNLKPRAWATFSEVWLPRAIEQLDQNDFVCNHPKKNFFTWLQDQMEHVNVGIKFMEGFTQPFTETELGQQAYEICEQARLGQRHYDRWSQERSH
jgi:hypothetical protein